MRKVACVLRSASALWPCMKMHASKYSLVEADDGPAYTLRTLCALNVQFFHEASAAELPTS